MAEPIIDGILVIDGAEFFRASLCRALADAGFRCAGFASLAEASAALTDPELALLILDLETTGPAGIEVFRTLRETDPALRAIVLSSHGGQDQVLAALRAGASDYLAKPLHEEELRLSVARALRGHHADLELSRLRAGAAAGAGGSYGSDGDLELARDLCNAVVADGDPGRVQAALLSIVAERLGARGAAWYRVSPGSGDLLREAILEGGALRDRERLPAGRGLTGAAAASGVFVASPDPEADPRFDPDVDRPLRGDGDVDRPLRGGGDVDRPLAGEGGGLVCLPLRFRGNTVGLVRLFLAPGQAPAERTAEIASAALSAAMRSLLLYRSWRSSIDEVARIRREAGAARSPRPPGWVTPE